MDGSGGNDGDRGSDGARNLLLRCWREPGTARLRGTVRDLSGAMLGAFETEKGLFVLLHDVLAARRRPGGDDNPEDPS